MTLTEISESVGLPLPTTKRHLDYLESIGRLHVEEHRGSKLYKWNGVEKYQYNISVSKDHIIYIDTMVNNWGQPFVRVKERKTMSVVIWLVIALGAVTLFYYFAVPPILNFISNAMKFLTSTEFLVGFIFGVFTVILGTSLTHYRFKFFS